MTGSPTARSTRRQPDSRREPRLPRALVLLTAVSIVGLGVAGALLWDSSSDAPADVLTDASGSDPGPVHVHGLGINPADGALFLATHTGLFRVGPTARDAVRVGDRFQDTMGFAVVGENRFLGSGHPDPRDTRLPPRLGLIQSWDAGREWAPVSLEDNEADLHVLRAAGSSLYGYDVVEERLLASRDEGRTWDEVRKPTAGQLVDLAIDPNEPRHVVATAAGGLDSGTYASLDGGERWKQVSGAVGLLAWPTPELLYLVDDLGRVRASDDGGSSWSSRGAIGGQPAALLAARPSELYVALHDATIKRSTNGGRAWTVRSTPSRE